MSTHCVAASNFHPLSSIQDAGFAILENVVASEEISDLLQRFSAENLSRSRAGYRHILKCDSVSAIAHDSRLLNIAREVLGQDAFPFRATLFDKSETANWLVAWHQDTALPLQERCEAPGWGPWSVKDGIHYAHAPASALEQVLALRLHLDDSTSANGPLRILPGTHNSGVLTDEAVHTLTTQIAPIECTTQAGGIIAMRPLVVHGSSKSRSSAPRRVLHIEYAASPHITEPLQLAIA